MATVSAIVDGASGCGQKLLNNARTAASQNADGERPGELVSKQELMARVWPNVFVEPANLTVHMSALRRTLRDGRDGNRFIINVPGRGYSFVASVAVAGRVKPHGDENGAAPREQP